jgi:peptidyl-prolyl cis-trans isomerase A (cyclophilin A)
MSVFPNGLAIPRLRRIATRSAARVSIVVAVALGATRPATAQAPGREPPAQRPMTAAQRRAVLLDPTRAFWSVRAPAMVTADIETSRGTITIELVREWAPNGVDRFYNLARAGYYDDVRFYRVLYGFVAQFGIPADPAIGRIWSRRPIRADSVRTPNARGTLSFAQFKPTDRTTHVFINLRDNPSLDTLGFAPVARVVSGLELADSLYASYGELPISEPPLGDVKRLYAETNRYMDKKYPNLDRIVKITIRPDSTPR